MKNPLLSGLMILVLFCFSCSKDDDPSPATGAIAVTINDPDGAAASGAQVQFFANESDATNNQNVISTFTGNAQGLVNIDIALGSYHVRVSSTDPLLLDQIAAVEIAATNAAQTIQMSWDAFAYVVGDWNVTAVDATVTHGTASINDKTVEGENYTFSSNGNYTFFLNTTQVLTNTWELDAEKSLIRISGSKVIVESYAADDLSQTISVPSADISDVETYAVATNSRQMVTLLSSGSFTVNGTEVTYSLNFQLTRK